MQKNFGLKLTYRHSMQKFQKHLLPSIERDNQTKKKITVHYTPKVNTKRMQSIHIQSTKQLFTTVSIYKTKILQEIEHFSFIKSKRPRN